MKGMNAVMGWLLMLAVLAVPSFLFYNWWAKNKAPAAAESAPAAVSQDVFPKQESSTPDLAVPASAAQTPAAQASGQAAAQPPAAPAAAQQPAAQPPAGQPSVQPQGGPGQPTPVGLLNTAGQGQAQKDQVKPAGGAPASTATAGGYNPKSTRNPMVSMEEFRRIKAEQDERAAEERAARMGLARKAKEPGWETRIRLQGIVGNAAIINGDMFYAGQNLLGGKLVKVSSDYIVLEYRGRKFTKKLQ